MNFRLINISLCLVLALGGCSTLDSDSCADVANMPEDERKANGCDGSLFSASSLRGTTYDGDDSARLWTGATTRTERDINPDTINARPSSAAPIVGYLGALRVEVTPNASDTARDLSNVQLAGAPTFDPDERVTVNFEEASIDHFLKQLLSGALGVNYIAPPNLGGSITFRTEEPLPKAQVVQVVRDVLGRNSLEMAFMNGVYHIANPDEMATLRAASASGAESDQISRVIPLDKGDASEVIAFVQQLVPPNVSLTPASRGSAIIVRSSPAYLTKITELISVADRGVSDDRVAIIPLRESSPEKITGKLNEFYSAQLGEDSGITVMPLENQQAILVGTKDARVMEGLRQLVRKLDRDTGSDFSLRIIPLTHLGSEEIVPQLNAIFTSGGGSVSNSGGDSSISDITSALSSTGSPTEQDSDFEDPRASESPPGDNEGARDVAPARVNTGSTQTIKIVADERNNTILVYSPYSLFKRISQLIKTLDVPQAQVVIEATVAEVTLNDQLDRGVEAFLTSNNILDTGASPITGPIDQLEIGSAATGNFAQGRFQVGGATVDVIIKALQEVTTVKVVSSPYLTVRDGKSARLVIGDQVPISRSTSTANPETGNVTVVEQIETKDTGVILEVTPRIRQDNSTILTINQSVSEVKGGLIDGNLTPTIATRQVESEVIAKSGATILLGGLIKDSITKVESGVPVLKDIDLIGELFKTTEDTARRQELIVLITPRVIRSSAQIENITRQLRGVMHIR